MGLKGNNYLKKALLTGVMRVSRESLLSGLNNMQIYSLFSDKTYTNDFGMIENEIDCLNNLCCFNKDLLKEWYNGIKVNGTAIYNIYSVLSYIQKEKFENYWGRSGTIELILNLLNENNYGVVRIPNRELMNVWKEFILSSFVKNENNVRTLFDNINNFKIFYTDIEYFLNNILSYFDIESSSGSLKTSERIYHFFVLGLLSAYEDISYKKPPISNRESGNGRYDILLERKEFSIIFEFKSVTNESQLKSAVEEGLKQIDEKQYFADTPKNKQLIKIAIAFSGKQCMVKSRRYDW